MNYLSNQAIKIMVLNESPSEKEGKFVRLVRTSSTLESSMKVPPKRKGNFSMMFMNFWGHSSSMKVPPKRKGNSFRPMPTSPIWTSSMKVPPKRKGNWVGGSFRIPAAFLNESPSEKEGKFSPPNRMVNHPVSSMKVPPKRKGNTGWRERRAAVLNPQ